ncbi:hypothetical protein L202_08316 [Cryptococcus amylolentus CBS 6039]|uniref:Proteasome activator PA28 C-terminal domain-containing protein n=1 Tax=Cryptococcus amylolentus CBS 6039 TaxID=1295533 RepID=A0A1E3H9A5_9TREE|nr:hypothetical protein L202_08316 [Cryptococcus amylolentus CBS 6039]ODN72893.1 hypothetical protein L202_08316 [Cryptococcus amylolentus CBS 6039]
MSKYSNNLPKMEDVMKTQPQPQVLRDLLSARRVQAASIIHNDFPSKILHIQKLLEGENDPNSPFWKDIVFEKAYAEPTIGQPELPKGLGGLDINGSNENGAKSDGEEGTVGKEKFQVVLPKDIVTCSTNLTEEQEGGIRLGMHWFEVFKVNETHNECIKIITKELEDLHFLAQDLKLWLDLEIPLVEDGNSFGAEVQQLVIRELLDTYKKCNSMQNGVRAHYTDRVKLGMDWAKYPNMADWKAAIVASDRFDHFLLRSYLRNILMSYSSVLTKMERNWPKVINPKGSSDVGGMY